MPRAKKKNSDNGEPVKKGIYAPSGDGEVEWGGYINAKIDSETKLVYEAWLTGDGAAFWADLEDAMGEGLKYGVSWDEGNVCFIATLTGNGVLGVDKRFCLSARSGRFEDATALLVFKHLVMAKGDWGTYRPRTGKFDSWG